MSPTKKAARKASKKAPAKKAVAKKAVAKKAVAREAVAKKAVAKKSPAKKPVAKKTPAKKSIAKAKKTPVCIPTDQSVDAHIGAIADPGRRQDCRSLVEVFGEATGKPARMWGGSIVAFGRCHYKYDSGREGDTCLAGFASRKGAITLYLSDVIEGRKDLMAKLGKYKTGKGCIYLKDLEGVDLQAVGELVRHSAQATRARYPDID